ncbi:hypothetical protein C9374_006538 [Naegleria lovaniensis]|uniref:Uncharacterized protein n=1 Tax=Naegleria lovaniensis TaxID=51637 RepID=A0AA88KIQ4_NAELO|nr:uncharacterized protein C9374_006538 [Naegleria lovaniensis]KAG2379421.1 hypothetical protein C9374_006538 [Naegleria lovaniensis]
MTETTTGSFLLASPKKKKSTTTLASMGSPTPSSASNHSRSSSKTIMNNNNNHLTTAPFSSRNSTDAPSTPLSRNHSTTVSNKVHNINSHAITPKSSSNIPSNTPMKTTPKSNLNMITPLSSHTNLSNPALSSNARNAENYFGAVSHFLSANFQQAIQVLKEQPSKNLLTKLLSARCYHHMEEPKTSLAILMKLCHENTSVYSNSTTFNDVYVRSVLACSQICIMICQLILFKILPKRFKLKTLLPEELELVKDSNEIISTVGTSSNKNGDKALLTFSVDKDYCHEYFTNCTLLLEKAQRLLTLLKKHQTQTEQVFDVPLLSFPGTGNSHNNLDAEIVTDQSLSKQIKTLKNHISFLTAIIHFRKYEYDYSSTQLSECKNLLIKLENKHTFLHTDMYITLARVCYIEEDYEQAHYYINKAERARALFRDLFKTEVGALTGEPVMLLLDSSYHFDMFDHVQDLSSKILLSKYFEYRIVKRSEDKERLLDSLDDINLKRRQHDRRLYSSDRFDHTQEFYAKLRKTVFKKYDVSLLEEMATWGLFPFVVRLAEILLAREEQSNAIESNIANSDGDNDDVCEIISINNAICMPSAHSPGSSSYCSSSSGSSNNGMPSVENDTSHSKQTLTLIFFLIKGLYLCKRFDKCLSTFVKYEKLLVHDNHNTNNTIHSQHLVKIYNWIIDSYVALNTNGYCSQLLTLKRVQEMVKWNLPHWKTHREILHVAIRFYKFLKQEGTAATVRGKLLNAIFDEISVTNRTTGICSSSNSSGSNKSAHGAKAITSSQCCPEFFEELLNTYLTRKVILLEGSSSIVNMDQSRQDAKRKDDGNSTCSSSSCITISTVSKQTPVLQFDDDLTLYSSFEDFAPKRAQMEKQKTRQALDELKRKREEKQQASKKNKLL